MNTVRTRFAPSPTGYLHIGGARTALFSFLYARHHGGRFILRIEDTDRERSTEESIRAILDAMAWLRLDWDEGPFYQTQRMALYAEYAERLLSEGHAYRCFCKPEDLDAKRQAALKTGGKPMYDRTCRDRIEGIPGAPFTIRFKAPLSGTTVVSDLVKGHVAFDNSELDDLILVRSDGTPTYNFCAVVDDATMNITHIIRGDDHLNNTPKQIHMYQAMGFDLPAFAHLPQILGPDRARLSKRHGATSVMAYKEMGYLPDALVNYLARLGWSHGDQEIFNRAELIEKFTLDSVGSAAGVYNSEKAAWLNSQYIKALTPEELGEAVFPYIEAAGYVVQHDPVWLAKMARTLQERSKTLVELVELGHYYFSDDLKIDEAAVAKHLKPETIPLLEMIRAALAELPEWNVQTTHDCFGAIMEKLQLGLGKLAQPVRVALTGGVVSPGIFEVLDVLGRERSLQRIDQAITRIKAKQGS